MSTTQVVLYRYAFFSFMAMTFNMLNGFVGVTIAVLSYYHDRCIIASTIELHGLCLIMGAIGFDLFDRDIQKYQDSDMCNHIISRLKQYSLLCLLVIIFAFCMSVFVSPLGACIMEQDKYHVVPVIVFAALVAHLCVISFFTCLMLASPHTL
jgi:hypothetical protein